MSRVTTRNPNPAPHSEEELLEQWDFLDRLVERQAAQLRAGIQDTEEVDEPGDRSGRGREPAPRGGPAPRRAPRPLTPRARPPRRSCAAPVRR